jgi:hypothetical protein
LVEWCFGGEGYCPFWNLEPEVYLDFLKKVVSKTGL